MFEVRLKPGHPTGTFRRAGIVFTTTPQRFEKVSDAVINDPWLEVKPLAPAASGVPTLDNFVKAGYKPEGYERMFFGLKPGEEYDAEVVVRNLLAAKRYDDVTIPDLRSEAEARKIELASNLKKAEIVELLTKYDAEHPQN